MMRIITGSARGTKLYTLDGDATRPTAERAKEAVFSVLQFRITGRRVLDLFAGSGQLGLEALSRGAGYALLCDNSREAVEIIRKNADKTHLSPKCDIKLSDALSLLSGLGSSADEKFDMVFLDPPYASGLVPKCLYILYERELLTHDAVVVCETARESDPFGTDEKLNDRYEILKKSIYGAARVTFVQPRHARDVAE